MGTKTEDTPVRLVMIEIMKANTVNTLAVASFFQLRLAVDYVYNWLAKEAGGEDKLPVPYNGWSTYTTYLKRQVLELNPPPGYTVFIFQVHVRESSEV